VSAGTSRRSTITDGKFYIDLRVYNVDDFLKTNPEDRYKKALVAVKLQSNENSSEWNQLQKFMGEAFHIFEDCEPVYYTNSKKY
jgi:hypothetical protein